MTLDPFAVAPLLGLLATTGPGGFALVNGTPAIITWTAPNDGQLHRVQVTALAHVTSAETGGQVNLTYFAPFAGATLHTTTVLAAGLGTDTAGQVNTLPFVTVQPGTVVSIAQGSALTAGAATVWAEIWGS